MFRRMLLPALLLFFAVATYLWRIGDKPVDLDERLTLNMATSLCGTSYKERVTGTYQANPLPRQPFTSADYWARFRLRNTLSTSMSDNGQGLPYMLALHIFLDATGVTVVHGRMLSVLLSLLAGALLLWFLRSSTPHPMHRLTAPGATVLLLFNGLFLDLSQYIRVYTLGVALAIASWLLLYRFQQKPTRLRAAGLGLTWAFLLLNHYFAAIIVLAQAIFLAGQCRQQAIPLRRLAFVAGGSGLVFFLWLFPLGGVEVVRAIFRYHSHEAHDAVAWLPTRQPVQIATGLAANLAAAFGQPTAFAAGAKTWANIFLALPAWAVCLRLFGERTAGFERFLTRVAALVLATQIVFVLAHVLATGKTLLFVPRYWIFCLPFTVVLLSLALQKAWQANRVWRGVALLSIVFLAARMGISVYSAWTGKRVTGFFRSECLPAASSPDIERLAQDIQHTWKPGDTVMWQSWQVAQEGNWFFRKSPQILQKIDSTQNDFARMKTPEGIMPFPLHLGQPATARPCR